MVLNPEIPPVAYGANPVAHGVNECFVPRGEKRNLGRTWTEKADGVVIRCRRARGRRSDYPKTILRSTVRLDGWNGCLETADPHLMGDPTQKERIDLTLSRDRLRCGFIIETYYSRQ